MRNALQYYPIFITYYSRFEPRPLQNNVDYVDSIVSASSPVSAVSDVFALPKKLAKNVAAWLTLIPEWPDPRLRVVEETKKSGAKMKRVNPERIFKQLDSITRRDCRRSRCGATGIKRTVSCLSATSWARLLGL